MAEDAKTGWNRRDMLGGAALLALAIGVPMTAAHFSALNEEDAPSPEQRSMLRDVSQLVIPRTETAGAGEVGVGDFVALALAHGLEKSRTPLPADAAAGLQKYRRRDGSLNHLDWLEAELDRRTGGAYLKKPVAQRVAALKALDTEAYAPEVHDHPWRTLKGLILTGYYTSEVGGSQELRFELVPGRFDPDVPLRPEDRAFSSDWTAVDFG